ncbi:MAG: hypothetical protein IJJ14_00260 [Coriobacteriales bacterium]|nr:hypothetical protein [Coriobacteriales bacterium]MBQ6585337.1 hypothetical protein [Coriobacteriales bacterium]
MGQLCIYLPPFASDYSGVCSALYDLGCLTIINDASCCTAHYVYCDEPRWSRQQRPVLCTTLRNVDAILGQDAKLVERVCDAAVNMDVNLIALVGTPVPAIIGMDTAGIAREVEALCGKPALGFDTTGFAYYDKGLVMAGKALVERFAERDVRVVPGRVNILGMSPLDFGDVGNDADLVTLLEGAGIMVGARFFMGLTLEQLRDCGAATLNLAVSAAGVQLAKYLRRRFGTPYLAGFPMGGAHTQCWLDRVKAALAGSVPAPQVPQAAGAPGRALIVGDQVLADSLRERMRLEGDGRGIDVASFFAWDAAAAQAGDAHLANEAAYLRLLRDGTYDALIADPFLGDVPAAADLDFTSLVHPAVSSKLHWGDAPRFIPS